MAEEQRSGTRRLLDNVAALYLLQGINYLIPMAVLPYLVRVLGMDVYGLVAFCQSFAQYFVLLTDYGFNLSATRAIAQNRDDHEATSKIFFRVYLIKFALMALGFVLLMGFVSFIPRFGRDASYLLVAYLFVVGNVLFPLWYFQGVERMRCISILTASAKVLSAVLLFVFVHQPEDGVLAVGIQSCGMIVAGVLGFGIAVREIGFSVERPSWGELGATLGEGWHLFVSTAAISLYTNTNVFLVGLLAGSTEAGYFSAAEKVIRAMSGVIGPVMQAIFPHVNLLAKRSTELAIAFASKFLLWVAGVTIVPSLLMVFLARPIALLCFGASGAGSVPIMRWIALLPFLLGISNVLGVQIMVPFGLDRQFSRILIGAGIANVVLAVPLITRFAAEGAGASVLITEVMVTLSMAVVLRKHGLSVSTIRRSEC